MRYLITHKRSDGAVREIQMVDSKALAERLVYGRNRADMTAAYQAGANGFERGWGYEEIPEATEHLKGGAA